MPTSSNKINSQTFSHKCFERARLFSRSVLELAKTRALPPGKNVGSSNSIYGTKSSVPRTALLCDLGETSAFSSV